MTKQKKWLIGIGLVVAIFVVPPLLIFGSFAYYAYIEPLYIGEPINPEVDDNYALNLRGSNVMYATGRDWLAGSEYKKINGADAETFEVLWRDFGKDHSAVYHKLDTIEGADPSTFERIGYGYYFDKNNVYCENSDVVHILAYANKEDFRLVVEDWETVSASGANLYFLCKRVEGADPENFEYWGDWFWTDGNYVYHQENRLQEKGDLTRDSDLNELSVQFYREKYK